MRLTTGYDKQTLLANAQSQVVQELLNEEKPLV